MSAAGRGSDPNPDSGSRLKRLAWFVGLWAASVAAVAGFAYGLRALFQL